MVRDGLGRCNQPVANRATHEVGGRTRPEQFHDLRFVPLRGPRGDVEQLGHFLGGMTFCEQL